MAFGMLATGTSEIWVAKLFGFYRVIVQPRETVQTYRNTYRHTKIRSETRPFIDSHAFTSAVLAGNCSIQKPPHFKPDD